MTCPKRGNHWWVRITGSVTAALNWRCRWCGAWWCESDDGSTRGAG